MAIFTAASEKIRNVCLVGHGGNGKTSLAEAMLHLAKASDRFGKVTDGNTVCDFDAEEIKRKFSLSAACAPFEWKGTKINIIDNPGYLDFVGEVKQSLRVCGTALIVMDAKSGVDVGCELAWDYAADAGVPRAFFVNKMDDENARFAATIDSLREKFGVSVCPIAIPIIIDRKPLGFADLIEMKGYEYCNDGSVKEMPIPAESMPKIEEFRGMLLESLAETSDTLMVKYFDGEEFTLQEMHEALSAGLIMGTIAPVMVGSSTTLAGVASLMDIIAASFPSPLARKVETNADGNESKPDPNGEPAIFVFKTVADPFVGKMSYFKVMNGKVTKNCALTNLTTGQQEKLAKLIVMRGNKQIETDELNCGDIGVTTKLVNTNTNDTLGGSYRYAAIKYPDPFFCKAIVPKAKGDEDKISSGISKLLEEDRTIKFENNAETKQLLIYGLGEQHLDVILAKLKNRFGTEVNLTTPIIAYRETIKKNVDAEGKHKKQSGGHGQYGHVKIHFAPHDDGLVFTESTVGGSVPKNFHPAVEKGLSDAMQKGVLAGYPMVGLKADLYDGSFHDVDSSEMSFKMAASLCYKDGLKRANPVLLEPVGTLAVLVPDSYMGDVIGDVNKRRGRILGMTPDERRPGRSIIEAEVPNSEMEDYTIALRAMTQGRGSFAFRFVRYEEVPANIAEKVIAEAAKNMSDDE